MTKNGVHVIHTVYPEIITEIKFKKIFLYYDNTMLTLTMKKLK